MKELTARERYILLKTVQNDNILPITSVCNMNCRFCSHCNNPIGLEVYRFGHLDISLIKELLEFLSPDGTLVIGESASKIIEGDPFTHPAILEIIYLIRDKFPDKQINITTNGSYLTDRVIKCLKENEPVELNISLNCSDPDERVFLMGDKNPAIVFEGLELFKEYNIIFHGSIVAMPHLMGWEYLVETIDFLASYQPASVRIYLPGYTRYAADSLKFDIDSIYNSLISLVDRLAEYYAFPLLLEPPQIDDFTCRIKGIIPASPAAAVPLKKNDIVKRVGADEVKSRVEAFDLITRRKDPLIVINRDNSLVQIPLKKEAGEKSGLVFDYDLDLKTINSIERVIRDYRGKDILLLTSILAEGLLQKVAEHMQGIYSKTIVDVMAVSNNFFGGSIACAGLLLCDDIIKAVKKNNKKYDLIVVPGIIFDIFGNDLIGKNYKIIAQECETEIEII